MKMDNKQARIVFTIMVFVIACLALNASAKEVPQQLPKPDAKAPDIKKPLKVYILSGQSNMVGMGIIAGDKPGTMETLVKKDRKFQHLVDDGSDMCRHTAGDGELFLLNRNR